MTGPHDTYTSPLATRNASPEMLRIWSPRHKFNTWRRIWLAVAEAQHEVTKDWGKDASTSQRARSASADSPSQRAPTVREGAESIGSSARNPLPDGRGSSGPSGPLVTKEQVEELRAVVERGITDAEIERAAELERELRHDVMAHVHCLGEQCPGAKGIIHLGCTSQDVVCNADLEVLEKATSLIVEKATRIQVALGEMAWRWAETPSLAFTHFQPAQPTTVGRRFAMLCADLHHAGNRVQSVTDETVARRRGLGGATGTQASYLGLFRGDGDAVDLMNTQFLLALEQDHEGARLFSDEKTAEAARVSELEGLGETFAQLGERMKNAPHMHEELRWLEARLNALASMTPKEYRQGECRNVLYWRTFPVMGQTYPRVIDTFILADLASVASVLHKIATDIRLLSNRKELDEPFGDKQIGSSAMPYKRNPMKCERICGLTRFVMNLVGNAYDTAATQWLERTLDDSSNRRLSLPEAFLALDGALDLMHTVASGLVVNEAMVRKNLMAELPFLATENIMMEAVKAGGDRQDLHEKIRVHAQAAGHRVKQEGLDNDLIERLRADPAFASVHHLLTEDQLLDPMKYVGRSVEQTERFLREVIDPLRERYSDERADLGSSDRGV
jgi:adenylosuccinate lyase